VEGRRIEAAFDGRLVSSDAGVVLLGRTDRALGLVDRFVGGFTDGRCAGLIEHAVTTLVRQRVYGIALGYEDLNDHDALRHDPVLAAVNGKLRSVRDDCAALAGKSTLNRLELTRSGAVTRYHKIGHDPAAIERLFVDLFVAAHAEAPAEIALDLDATDDPVHGRQEGRFFRGFYDGYCYLPLYVFGLARNDRLVATIEAELAAAAQDAAASGQPARRFKELRHRTLDSWSRERRVVAKAEVTHGKENPRFVVTSPALARHDARALYEDIYCARGKMENKIKECQLDLFADRTSAATMMANQLRLWFVSMARVLVASLRRRALQATTLARATCANDPAQAPKKRRLGAHQRASGPAAGDGLGPSPSAATRQSPTPLLAVRVDTTQTAHRPHRRSLTLRKARQRRSLPENRPTPSSDLLVDGGRQKIAR